MGILQTPVLLAVFAKPSRAVEVLEAVKTGKPVAAKESAPAAAAMAAD